MGLAALPGRRAESVLSDHVGVSSSGTGMALSSAKGTVSITPYGGRPSSTGSLAAGEGQRTSRLALV